MAEIKIEATDYHSKTEYLNIYRDKSYTPEIELVRHTGKLIIISNPPDATVVLDDNNEGKTPKILNNIWTGKHHLKITHPDFLTQSENFSLKLDEKKEFRFELMTYAGSVQQDIDFAKEKRNRYLGISIATAIVGAGLQYFADAQYDEYNESSSKADDLLSTSTLMDKLSIGSYALAGISGSIGLKFTIDLGILNNKLKN